MDKLYEAQLAHHAALADQATLYQSVQGVGRLTAATLVAWLPELGQFGGAGAMGAMTVADNAAIAPYVAVVGRAPSLNMAALSAVRHNAELRCFPRGYGNWEAG